ncbi:hypothetical protein, variant [Verruconis gallopava]|uniref:UBC core domain-containing protein n=1 Tax=Verruconis gallopava TaxID=253628 RepID=A0A0D2AGM9_9PEZI|nr:hypothetical protein, variant [Verruconis gallopava]KIW06063.1 hypothetical protein, variant [Verruconis gallopava]
MPSKRFKMDHEHSNVLPSYYFQKAEQNVEQCLFGEQPGSDILSLPTQNAAMDDSKSALRAYGMQLTKATCSSCSTSLLPDANSAAKIAESLHNLDASSFFSCQKCYIRTCIGCGMSARALRRPAQFRSCCPQSQIFCIWIWLCAPEIPYHAKEDTKKQSKEDFSKPTSPEASTKDFPFRKPNGTGYGGANSYIGTSSADYSDEEFPSHVFHKQSPSRLRGRYSLNNVKLNKEVILAQRLFRALNELLSEHFANEAYLQAPPSLLFTMFQRSRALEIMATMLRTDSFEEIASNSDLFCNILDLIAKLADHYRLAPLVLGPRSLYPVEQGLLSTTLLSHHILLPKNQDPNEVAPIIQLLDKFFHSTSNLRKQATRMQEEFLDTESRRLLRVCEHADKIFHFVQERMKAFSIPPTSCSKPEAEPVMTLAHQMAAWHREHCVESVDDDTFKHDFYFVKEQRSKVHPAKGRMKRILTEIATLQSALPEGIFVRYATSRPDLMKVLIIGPRETPYAHGLFEFDMMCPWNYPQLSPKMHFKTTGKGTAHFNPNLYPDGKVCLSLLGTWSGPSWEPNRSTILQVLVSIQAMIFCSEPWYNEPGREGREMKDQSRRFNAEVQILTIRHALVDVLVQATKSRSQGCWHDVIEKHFRTYGSEIMNTLKDWQKKAEKMPDRMEENRFAFKISSPPLSTATSQSKLPKTFSSGFQQETQPDTGKQSVLPTWHETLWPKYSQVYAPHPHYSTSPMKRVLGAKLAALANHYQSTLVFPTPGTDTYFVDLHIPSKFNNILQEIAVTTRLPLVVPENQHTQWAPNTAPNLPSNDSFYFDMFQKIQAIETQSHLNSVVAAPSGSNQSTYPTAFATTYPSSKTYVQDFSAIYQAKQSESKFPHSKESSALNEVNMVRTMESLHNHKVFRIAILYILGLVERLLSSFKLLFSISYFDAMI